MIQPKNNNVFRVTTDGTESSLFRIAMDMIDTNFVLQIAEDGLSYDTTNYGKFTFHKVEGKAMYFTYKHPYNFTKPFQSIDTLELELRHRRDHRIIPLGIIEVYRPPVLMVHGIWSSAQTFNDIQAALHLSKRYKEFQLFRLDYFFSRAASFETNKDLIPKRIATIKNAFRDSGIVCKEIVVIAHSMGGLVLRQYVQSLSYKNDIDRFIGLNVPHCGSAMANFIMESPKLASLLNFIQNSTDGGAIRDLCVDSDQILNILNNKIQLYKNIIPSHSIVTKTIPHPPFSDPSEKSKRSILTEILNENRIAKIHNQAQNDEVVTIEGQSGGLEAEAITLIENEVHTGATENQKVINTILNLLEIPSNYSSYSKSGFKPPRLIYKYGRELVKPMIANTRSSHIPKVLIPDQKTKYSTADKISFYIYKPLEYNQLNVFIQSPDGNINTISSSKSEDTLSWWSSDKIPGPIKVFITTSTISDPLSFIDSITGLFLLPVDSITSITSDKEKVEADQNEYTPMQVMGTDMHGKAVNLTYAYDLRMITKNGLVIWQDGQLLHRSPGTDTIYFKYRNHRSNHTIIHITPATPIPSVSLTRKGPICKSIADALQVSTILGLRPPYTYLWSTGDTSYKLKHLPAGYYSVLVTDSDSKQAEAGIMLYTGLNPWESTDTVLKAGSILTSSVIPQASYRWSTGDTGTYTTIKSSEPISFTSSRHPVVLYPIPSMSILPSPLSLCTITWLLIQ
ncbi:MAG: hypothetical protein IPL55_00335 [Saprospiraceae bacterium]|nr:hypothetical protein [Saprospiraceae bacterium]